jgi:type I restriction-modification system DNA methylase subunit
MATQQANALFHTKTLNKALKAFTFPPDLAVRHQKIQQWIATLKTGTLNQVKEVSLHGDFLKDTFQEVLGYRSVIQGGGKSWELHAEQAISDGGGSADGALGFFTAVEGKKGKVKLQGRVVAPIELKGAKDDLDRPAPGRKESAVEQGWRYANYTPDCRWVIVSNYRELRLYQTSKTPAYYERFLLTELADIEAFKRFYFLLCRDNFLPKTPQELSATDQLLAASNEAQEEITKQLYSEYKDVRLSLVKHFRFTGSQDIPDQERVLIEKAQKTLDRLLFVAFCEDRGLLPPKTIAQAHDYKDPYNPRPIWDNYKAVFRWVDKGNDNPPIPGYNGGLFQPDPLLDEQLTVPDPICSQLKQLTRFDFDTEVSVDILGRIFEQSVTDLEELKAEATGQDYNKKKGKRKTQGVFYTPAFITQYIVEVALGGYLKQREQEIRDRFQLEQIPKKNTKQRREAEIKLWETYRDEVLRKTRVIDPACGSGAFLIAAFDYLMREYERVNLAIAALELQGDGGAEFVGQRSLFDLNKTILNSNLYGVDLSPESVEITKLSLWLKTAEAGQTLTYLDDNIKVGNSIVDDSSVAERAFNWQAEFSDVFAVGGFDVVIGNPPYVRQELLSPIKPYLQAHYESYDGVADLYAYFYEKGVKILKSGGVLSYIVTNKWLRAGYGEPLRQFFSQNSVFEQIIDFGHAPIFEDADTFPCIVAVQKPVKSDTASETQEVVKPEPQSPVLVCPVPREKLSDINLAQYVQQEGYTVPWSRFTGEAWSLEPPAVDELMQKIRDVGVALKDFAGVNLIRGILQVLIEAFLIDNETRNRLIQDDPKSAEIIKPCLTRSRYKTLDT